MATTKKTKTEETVTIKPANIVQTTIQVKGLTPYMQNRFSTRAKEKLLADYEKEPTKTKKVRAVRNYAEEFSGAQYFSVSGWNGIPCAAFRGAMIRACSLIGLEMTKAKMSLFILPDGFDRDDGTPLVELHSSAAPEMSKLPVRTKSGSFDIRIRPMWREWWCNVTVSFDADMLDASSVVNLLDRAGKQVGLGEGRNYSRESPGMGLGTFFVEDKY